MFTLVLTALLLFIAVISVLVLADSGLRWWSAFGQLRCQLGAQASPFDKLPRLRTDTGDVRLRSRAAALRPAFSRAAA